MLVDSNILVYAINSSSPKHKKAQEFLQENTDKLIVSHQNILESIRVLTHRKFENPMKIDKAVIAIEDIVGSFQVAYPDFKTITTALNFIKKYQLSADLVFDAYLVATAISNGIFEIATDNVRDLEKFREIKVVNPFK